MPSAVPIGSAAWPPVAERTRAAQHGGAVTVHGVSLAAGRLEVAAFDVTPGEVNERVGLTAGTSAVPTRGAVASRTDENSRRVAPRAVTTAGMTVARAVLAPASAPIAGAAKATIAEHVAAGAVGSVAARRVTRAAIAARDARAESSSGVTTPAVTGTSGAATAVSDATASAVPSGAGPNRGGAASRGATSEEVPAVTAMAARTGVTNAEMTAGSIAVTTAPVGTATTEPSSAVTTAEAGLVAKVVTVASIGVTSGVTIAVTGPWIVRPRQRPSRPLTRT